MKLTILHGDNRQRLKEFPDNHFDACVCDPPYELGFMGKKWDSSGISYDVEMWRQVLRVMKPGAHLLAFGGSRTYHRLACAIEDAGFIIRDQIMWLYGSGFPKNLDVSKALDKAAGAERGYVKDLRNGPNTRPETKGDKFSGGYLQEHRPDSGPVTPLAQQWDGWGTALKPAHEPIVVARKPLEDTVIKNVLKWGAGAINCDSCRIAHGDNLTRCQYKFSYDRKPGAFTRPWNKDPLAVARIVETKRAREQKSNSLGRWPTNVIHDGSDEVMLEFEKYGDLRSGAFPKKRHAGARSCFGNNVEMETQTRRETNAGSAARFFYCAKASQEERNRGCESMPKIEKAVHIVQSEGRKKAGTNKSMPTHNNHPTVKPLALMAYLVRLVTPPGGVVLDPFMGSGSTLIAAAKEGFDSVGIDLEPENLEIAKHRFRGHLGLLAEVI